MDFEWDTDKSEKCEAERGFNFAFAALIFEGPTVERVDARKPYGEVRINAIGEADGLVLHVTFTDRGSVRRIISARKADRKERLEWQSRA